MNDRHERFAASNPPGLSDPTAVGFSQVVRVGDLLFISGQVGRSAGGELVGKGDIAAQAERAYANLKTAVESAGSRVERIAKITVYATDPRFKPAIDEARRRLFEPTGHRPASTFIVVSGFAHPEYLVEIEAVAQVG